VAGQHFILEFDVESGEVSQRPLAIERVDILGNRAAVAVVAASCVPSPTNANHRSATGAQGELGIGLAVDLDKRRIAACVKDGAMPPAEDPDLDRIALVEGRQVGVRWLSARAATHILG
jgi:hypothetical protein